MNRKPLGRKNYGSIPYLPNSRLGLGDHKCSEGQAQIATFKTRDKNDEIYALTRAGHIASSSPFEQHNCFIYQKSVVRASFGTGIRKANSLMLDDGLLNCNYAIRNKNTT